MLSDLPDITINADSEDSTLVGGVYGVALGGAFFGESMFSRRTNASKIALAWLVHRLRAGGFSLFDTQFLTPHLASLGGVEITRAEYHRRLVKALEGSIGRELALEALRPDGRGGGETLRLKVVAEEAGQRTPHGDGGRR